MTLPITIETERLVLRQWEDADFESFAEMNADPQVMEFFPALLSTEESRDAFERITTHFDKHGFGFWALERKGVTRFIGLLGLAIPRFEAPFTPCVEIGWRLLQPHWGHGFAPEGAKASLQFAFKELELNEVVSFTTVTNRRSQRVMEKIGMSTTSADNFDHPMLPDDHPMKPHVLYRMSKERWESL